MFKCPQVKATQNHRLGQAPFTGHLRQTLEDTVSFLQRNGPTPMFITTTGLN